MSRKVRRGLSEMVCCFLQSALPPQLQSWGWAVRCEVAEIANDTDALLFALSSLFGLVPRIVGFHLLQPFVALIGKDAHSSGGTINMSLYDNAVRQPRSIGIACAVGAVMLGLAYMAVAGAPTRYLGINVGALVVGLVMLALIGRIMLVAQGWFGVTTLIMAIMLLATALVGDQAGGATRWVKLGALSIQPSLILLPVMIVGFARSRNALSTAGMIGAAVALAIQPDRAMAGMLAASLTILAVVRPDRFVIPALVSSIIGVTVTLIRADTLPAMPYVDQILYSSFGVHALAGLAVLGGSALLLVPAIVGKLYDLDHREAYLMFGVVWLAAIVAAALGNYPTPIVGYGGSAILGYVLSLMMLPKAARSCFGAEVPARNEASNGSTSDRHLCVGSACAA